MIICWEETAVGKSQVRQTDRQRNAETDTETAETAERHRERDREGPALCFRRKFVQ